MAVGPRGCPSSVEALYISNMFCLLGLFLVAVLHVWLAVLGWPIVLAVQGARASADLNPADGSDGLRGLAGGLVAGGWRTMQHVIIVSHVVPVLRCKT